MRLVELKALASEMITSDDHVESPNERFVEISDDIKQARRRFSETEARIVQAQEHTSTEQDVADALRKLDPVWDELFPSEQHRILRALVEGVVVMTDGLDIRLRADGIHSVVTELKDSEERVCMV